ncbi:MAG TPA: ATPase domain-containing protein [Burkholderiales bacterium]|nr:ATPase domain-containing protein [Burkholderiales bacterium]
MSEANSRSRTGVPGLDDILGGGLPRACLYLVDGNPGVGKTTLALQFLQQGVREGERGLYITLSETKAELDAVARSHGWDLSGVAIIELSAIERSLAGKSQNTLFQSAEVELAHLSKLLLEEVDRLRPQRVVLDSLSEMRLLAQNPLRYRRQILTFKQRFAERGCTVLLLDDRSAVGPDVQVHSIVHGLVSMAMAPLKYGMFRRSLTVAKLRGVEFREGQHDYVIRRGGISVFPRLIAAEHHRAFEKALQLSGNAELDALVGGGLHTGTSNLIMGPAGSGKSTIATMFAHAAVQRGQHVGLYAFDESSHILLGRAREMGIPLEPHIDAGRLHLQQMDPAQIAPGELADSILRTVEKDKMAVVVLDSLNGYVNAMPNEDYLYLHLHELLTYLNQQGVLTLMILAQHGLVGPMGAPVDVSYLADTVILTRFFEARGAVKKAISVIKKRSGPHENTLRELTMLKTGIALGAPLTEFEGVLTGVPRLVGGSAPAPKGGA